MKYRFLRFPEGKTKAVTMSYDDGSKADGRVAQTLTRYGLKGTFNLMGSLVESEAALTKEFIRTEILGKGHEIATHGYNHRGLDVLTSVEVIRDTLDCRMVLEREFGIIVRGMAYPDRSITRDKRPGAYEQIRPILQNLDIAYSRLAGVEDPTFELPADFLYWSPTAHQRNPKLMEYIDNFLTMDVSAQYIASRTPRLLYIWGHGHEFDRNNDWELLDTICEKIAGKEEIWYATNGEIYEYVQAFRSLIYSADGMTVYNPTLHKIWFDVDKTLYTVNPGETIRL